jgi:hypothetical protein
VSIKKFLQAVRASLRSNESVILCSLPNYSMLDQAQEELKSFQEAAITMVSSMKTETYHKQRIPTLRRSVGLFLTDSESLLILQSSKCRLWEKLKFVRCLPSQNTKTV